MANRGLNTWHGPEAWLSASAYLAVVILALVNFGPAEKTMGEEAQGWISYIALAWLIFSLLIIAPFALWRDAMKERNGLIDVADYEKVLGDLSAFLDEGNTGILNARVANEREFGAWKERSRAWMKKVENFLELHFGAREKNSFHHIVVLEPWNALAPSVMTREPSRTHWTTCGMTVTFRRLGITRVTTSPPRSTMPSTIFLSSCPILS